MNRNKGAFEISEASFLCDQNGIECVYKGEWTIYKGVQLVERQEDYT